MTIQRYRGRLGRLSIASVEQVVASVGLGDDELRERARADNGARLEQAISDLLDDLGMRPNELECSGDSRFWFRAFVRLARRHVPAMRPLKIPGAVGRPVSPENEEADPKVDAAIQAKPKNQSIRAACEELAALELGTGASADAVRARAVRMRQRFHDRRRRRKSSP